MIEKEMKIEDVLRKYPQTTRVFARFGVDCVGCQLSEYENLEHISKVHKVELAALLKELNEALEGTGQ